MQHHVDSLYPSTWKLFVLVGAIAADTKATKYSSNESLEVNDDASEEVNPANKQNQNQILLSHTVPGTPRLFADSRMAIISHQIAQKGTMTGQNIVLRRHFQSPIVCECVTGRQI